MHPDANTNDASECRSLWTAAFAIVAALAVAILAASVWFGPLNQDEGWYLLAAQNVGRGLLPYRDFFYTQGPAMPFAYALFLPLWSPLGVLGGRITTAVFGLLAAAFAAAFTSAVLPSATYRHRRFAALFAFAGLVLSPDWTYFSVIPKTYSLGAFYLCFGALLCTFATSPSVSRRRAIAAAAVSGVCFALAAATRATLALAAPPFFLALLLGRSLGRQRRRFANAAAFAIGCAAALAAIYLPVVAKAPDNFFFAQTYHTARAAAPLGQWIVLRAAFVCFLAQGYPLLFVGAAFAFAAKKCRSNATAPHGAEKKDGAHPLFVAACAAFALVTAAHFFVPFPYSDYNTPVMPLAAATLAVCISGIAERARLSAVRTTIALAAASLALFAASPWPMKWVGGRQDRFWFSTEPRSQISKLRDVGKRVREIAIRDASHEAGQPPRIFTQDAYIAVEAGLPVAPGLEMGPFGLFPGLDDETARKRRVHNAATLREAATAPDLAVAALSGYSFAISCPSTEPMPESTRKELLDAVRAEFPANEFEVERFGQQETLLSVHSRRKAQ